MSYRRKDLQQVLQLRKLSDEPSISISQKQKEYIEREARQALDKIRVARFLPNNTDLYSTRPKASIEQYVDRILTLSNTPLSGPYLCPNPECNTSPKDNDQCAKNHIGGYLCAHPICLRQAIKTPWRYKVHWWGSMLGLEHYLFSFLRTEKDDYDIAVQIYESNPSSYGSLLDKKRQQSTCLYLVEAGGKYKIGRATNVASRINSLQVGCPVPIYLVHTIQCINANTAEKEVHRLLRPYRVDGEWFALSDDKVKRLKQIERIDLEEDELLECLFLDYNQNRTYRISSNRDEHL